MEKKKKDKRQKAKDKSEKQGERRKHWLRAQCAGRRAQGTGQIGTKLNNKHGLQIQANIYVKHFQIKGNTHP